MDGKGMPSYRSARLGVIMFENIETRASAAVRGKTILITGAAGTIGSALAERLLAFEPEVVRLLDNDEERSFFLKLRYAGRKNIRVLLGDIRDRERMAR